MRRFALHAGFLAAFLSAAAASMVAAGGTFGCSSSDPAAAAPVVDAGFSINGHPFAVQEQGALRVMSSGDVPHPVGYQVELYNQDTPNGCAQIRSNAQYGTVLQLHFPEKPSGTYPVLTGNTVFYVKGDANAAVPKDGYLVITQYSDTLIAGTYDVKFVSGEHLSGTFKTPLCN